MEKSNREVLKNRIQELQKSITENNLAKDSLHKEAMKFSGKERASLFQAACQYTNKIAVLRKEINSIFRQLKKK